MYRKSPGEAVHICCKLQLTARQVCLCVACPIAKAVATKAKQACNQQVGEDEAEFNRSRLGDEIARALRSSHFSNV
jgi:hypothetical protein